MKPIKAVVTLIPKNSVFMNRLFTQISLPCIFALFANISLGQKEECKTIEGSFKDKRITDLNHQSVNHNDNYKIHLKELKTALYKVQFKFNDFDWETEPPGILEQTIMPKIESFTGDRKNLFRESTSMDAGMIEILNVAGKINEIILFINQYPVNIENANPNDIQSISKTGLEKLKFEPSDYAKGLTEFQNNIAYIKGLYIALKEFNAESPNGSFEYVQLLASLEGTVNQLNSKNYPKLLSYIISFAKEIPKNFVESDVHFPEKEVTTLQIIVTNRFDPSDTICNYTTDIYRTGVFKIDFSTGIGVNSLVKPTYSIGNNGSPYIHKENGRDADLSVMALLHANWRFTRNFTFGPTAGVSVSTFDANTGFVLGVSGSFGTRNTISLSAGGIMGKSFKLSSRVSSDGNKADIPLESGITEVPKVDIVKFGGFVSVTYNLTRIKKKP
jgi:hypothetical protein